MLRFPIIDSSVPNYEEIPVDVLLIHKHSKQKAAAEKFLAFMSRPEIQEELNQQLGFLPANAKSNREDLPFSKNSREILESAAGFSQYLDRDTKPEFADKLLPIIRNFLITGDI